MSTMTEDTAETTAINDTNEPAIDQIIESNENIQSSEIDESLNQTHQIIENDSPLEITPQTNYIEQELTRLRELIAEKTNENQSLEKKLLECEQQANLKIEQLNQNFTLRLEQTLKKFQDGHKDKTSSLVMKYAEAEKKCIDLNRSIEHLQSKLQDAQKEKLNLNEKVEKIKQDNQRISGEYEKKCQEVLNVKKELEKLKESLVLSDAREKACQLKLKQEIEAHDMLKQKVSEQSHLKEDDSPNEEVEKSDKIEVNTLNQQQNDEKYELTLRELNALKSQLKDMFEERITLRDKVQCMDQERKLQEASLAKFKETLQSQKQMNSDLLNEILQLRELQETLAKEKIEKENLETKLKLVNSELNDLQADMANSQEKQNELLAFTSKLTQLNSQLQSENSNLSEKLLKIERDYDDITQKNKTSNEDSQLKLDRLNENLKLESEKTKQLSDQLNEKQKQIEDLTTRLDDEHSEIQSLKKKHAANIKDLSRQLQQLQKKLNEPNSAPHPASISPNLKQNNSRANSITSLNERDSFSNDLGHTMLKNSGCGDDETKSISSEMMNHMTRSVSSNNHFNEVICGNEDVYVVDVDKQKIIEKIVKLQKTLAKRNEKIDFLQDHVNQLTNDLKRKTKIIQAYAMNEEVGQFTSETHDAIKREMSRKTGSIMSALYSSNKHDTGHMTMELCTEINSKLQALLEDTLIKNLTLKDNLETLGQEISRLSKENRQIKLNNLKG